MLALYLASTLFVSYLVCGMGIRLGGYWALYTKPQRFHRLGFIVFGSLFVLTFNPVCLVLAGCVSLGVWHHYRS